MVALLLLTAAAAAAAAMEEVMEVAMETHLVLVASRLGGNFTENIKSASRSTSAIISLATMSRRLIGSRLDPIPSPVLFSSIFFSL